MYESFYNLHVDPFRLAPDHRFSFRHPSYRKAHAYMQYALARSEGFVMVTGRPGTGKTTLINDLVGELNPREHTVARLATTQLHGQDFLRAVAYAFGLQAAGVDQATLLRQIEQFLISNHQRERRALLLVDEAQDLHVSALTELRLLANMQQGNQLLFQAFLVGQESLLSSVTAPGMEQFHQRIIAAGHLEPLTEEETLRYVAHRLRCAGWQGDPAISKAVLPIIHEFSGGIPRQINLAASRLLLYGFTEGKHSLFARDAVSVVDDLGAEGLSAGNFQMSKPPDPLLFAYGDEVADARGSGAPFAPERGPAEGDMRRKADVLGWEEAAFDEEPGERPSADAAGRTGAAAAQEPPGGRGEMPRPGSRRQPRRSSPASNAADGSASPAVAPGAWRALG